MNPLQKMTTIFNRLIDSRTLNRRRNRHHFWTAEVLELRTLMTMPLYVLQTGSSNPMNGLAGGPEYFESHPVLADLNGDQKLDLIVGRSGGISYFENTGTVNVPSFTERTGLLNPFSNLGTVLFGGFAPAPALADWDGNGTLDLLLATPSGLTAYANTGTKFAASFAPLGPVNPFAGLFTDFAIAPVPAFADMNGDSKPDLLVSTGSSFVRYFVNTGTTTSPSYQLDGSGGPFASVSLGSFGSPTLGDVDQDGDVDLVAASFFANLQNPVQLKFFENTGSATNPHLTAVSEVFNDQFSVYTGRTAPALGDLDGDGKQDLLLAVDNDVLGNGVSGSGFRYYHAVENPVAFKPKNTVPLSQLAKEDVAVVFSVANGNAISVADPNALVNDVLQVTLSVEHGTLTLATVAGLTFTSGDGVNDATLTFRGIQSQLNAALNGLTYRPAVDFSGVAKLTITTSDFGQAPDATHPNGGPPLSDTDSVPITVQSVATQVETLKSYITGYLVPVFGLNQNIANVLSHMLDLTGQPVADSARIKAFMLVVRAFGHAGILTDGNDLFLLNGAQDILTGIKIHA